MIQLYAIVNESELIEAFFSDRKKKKSMQALVKHIQRKVQSSASKLVMKITVDSYHVYYFKQEEFLFILATQNCMVLDKKIQREQHMKSYLRVVADIFYENNDEKKFNYILNRIMNQINRIEGRQSKEEDEEDQLVSGLSIEEDKRRINQLLLKKNKESRLAYIITTILFVCILILGVNYIAKKWG